MKLTVNQERAAEVVQRVRQAFVNRKMLLAEQDDLVENQAPTSVRHLSRDHANFLFFTVFNDHGVKSSRMYSRARDLFEEDPGAFRSAEVVKRYCNEDDSGIVAEITGRLGVRYPKEAARSWYLNSLALCERFRGEAHALLSAFSDASELLRALRSFRGYGPKTAGMLVRAVAGLGFASLRGVHKVLVPVDVHDTRIAFLTGIVSDLEDGVPFPEDYTKYIRVVQETLLEACRGLEESWLNADRALWLIGSRGCTKLRCVECPLMDLCAVGQQYA